MALNARFRPLRAWPGPATPYAERHSRNSFKASYGSSLSLLERELRHLNASDIVIEIDVLDREIRNDGWPRSDARPSSPGVILYFTHPDIGPMRYASDSFDEWQHNLRAIALGLEALRKVDRYGITKGHQQYTGFRALPERTQPSMTTEQAAAWIGGYTNYTPAKILADHAAAKAQIRAARFRAHPDRNAGSDGDWRKTEVARQLLEQHHGRSLS